MGDPKKKKPFDVAGAFQEVAKRATATPVINAAPSSQKKAMSNPADDAEAFNTRPGRVKGPNSGRDVNLPNEGINAAPTGFGQMSDYEARKLGKLSRKLR